MEKRCGSDWKKQRRVMTTTKITIDKTWWRWLEYQQDKRFRDAIKAAMRNSKELNDMFQAAMERADALADSLKGFKK